MGAGCRRNDEKEEVVTRRGEVMGKGCSTLVVSKGGAHRGKKEEDVREREGEEEVRGGRRVLSAMVG